ncbi:hypothetical protein I203_106053 [Kwoniella mangroviensis CBS 8507]|uniref:uncharacterized protein n=1 Tax=Kwoniella mangroviensis CBS 8507 TaxID=1296122 RepID=UPI00080D36FA|nr:uncharacterized protein I203_04531 [Kwoniella mangroviensis CBS 8507]OCF66205.1 hypothetical protein I203_04531 [Kwoniella mangroviensis CBS 8507]
MASTSTLPPPSNSSQPPTPFLPQPDPSTSPSISNNPPPQPPPAMPAYASINSAPYSAYSQQQQQHVPHTPYVYQPPQPYYPPQPPRHSHSHNVPYNSSAPQQYNRYQDPSQSYPHQHYPSMYHQHPYGTYPGMQMGGGGGGGPGPATIQNGYAGYPPETYQHIPYGVYPQQGHYAIPQESYQQQSYTNQPNGNAEEPESHPPPSFPSHDQSINGHIPPSQHHQSFHPTYPPNHPYAYGSGVGSGYSGYQPPQQQLPVNYGGYSGYQDGYIPPNPAPSGQRSFSKSLNPSAAGFSFTPSSASGSRANSQPSSTPVPNGDTPSSALDQSSQPPSAVPSIIDQNSAATTVPNRHSHDLAQKAEAQAGEPSVQNVESGKDHIENGLGLTTKSETPVSSSAQSTNPNISASASTTNATESTAATTVSSPVSAQTPKAPEGDLPTFTSQSAEPQSSWTFVGEGLAGVTSPNSGPASRRVSGPSISSASSSISGKKRNVTLPSTSFDPLRLSNSKPDHISEKSNVYSASLRNFIPDTVKVQESELKVEKKVSQSKKGKKEPSKKKTTFAFGDAKKSSNPQASKEAKKIVFGEVDPSVLYIPNPPIKIDKSEPEAQVEKSETKPTPPSSDISTPQPKIKHSSWAALVRGPSATSSSVAPSKAPSPARSTTSLPHAESEAGPSRLPSHEPSAEHVTSPAPVENKKVPFNYAAAAAVGATMTPQEELAKLLSEGVKGKGRETAQATLPRGLINTGNMCFANTILQVLVYCSPFTELFEELGKRLKADLARKTPLLEAMIIFLREFNAPFPPPSAPLLNAPTVSGTSTPKGKGKDPRREAFIPENVYDAMKENKRFDSMRRGHQEDAEEYLGFFLNTLHEELLYVLSRTQPSVSRNVTKAVPNGDSDHREITRPVSPGAGDESGWLEVGKKQKTHVVRATESKESAISRIFGGTIRSLLRTPGSKDSVTLEPYQPLQLDIQSSNVLSIEDALKHLTEPEIVPGVWSQTKKAQVDATKQILIETFPQVWILHLKRFVYDPKEYNVVKKDKGIAYSQELIVPPEIISPGRRGAGAIKYRLFGVVYHHGASASGGHYTVAVSRQDGGGWIHFDDELVTNIPKEDVIVSKEEAESGKIGLIGGREKTAYLLFYQRVR